MIARRSLRAASSAASSTAAAAAAAESAARAAACPWLRTPFRGFDFFARANATTKGLFASGPPARCKQLAFFLFFREVTVIGQDSLYTAPAPAREGGGVGEGEAMGMEERLSLDPNVFSVFL